MNAQNQSNPDAPTPPDCKPGEATPAPDWADRAAEEVSNNTPALVDARFDYRSHIAAIIRRHAQTNEAKLREAMQDTKRLDWLSENLCYAMISSFGGSAMQLLKNRGHGWGNNELRDAIDAALNQQEERK